MMTAGMKVYVIHENPEWYAPLGGRVRPGRAAARAVAARRAVLDLAAAPPPGVFWSRMSASSHTRGHPFAKDQTRGSWPGWSRGAARWSTAAGCSTWR